MKKLLLILYLTLSNSFNSFCAQQNPPDQQMGASHAGQKRTADDALLSLEEERDAKRWKIFKIKSLLERVSVHQYDEPHQYGSRWWEFDDDISNIKRFFNDGADVNTPLDEIGETALIKSSRYSKLNQLSKWLIMKGADVDKKDFYNNTALSNSVSILNLELTDFLLQHGANVDVDYGGNSILFRSILMKSNELIKLLLTNGALLKVDELPILRYEKIFDEVVKEIGTQYRRKIQQHNQQVKEGFCQPGLPPELVNIVCEFLIPEYKTNQKLLSNIMNIRYALNELSPIQKAQFELKQQQELQQQAAANAGGSSGGAAAGSAAAASVAESMASRGGGGGAAAMLE